MFRLMLLSRKVLIPSFGLLTVWPTMSLEELRHPASSQLPPSRCALMSRRWCLVSLSARSCCKALYSTGVSRFTRPVVDPKAFNKVKLASQWAREAGHVLDASGRCASFGLLCVDSKKSSAYLEACLHLPCLGSTNSGAGYKPHQVSREGSDSFLFHGLQVHCSHTIATSFKLRVHFCTRCGHFGPPGGKAPGLTV